MTFLGVAGQDSLDNMQGFIDEYSLPMTNIADPDGRLSSAHFEIIGHSSWIFIDGETGEVTRHVGPLSREALEERVRALAT